MAEPNSIKVLALDIDGVLTDGRVFYTADGQEQKAISYRDIDAIFEAHRHGLKVVLATGEETPWSDFIGRRLKVDRVIRGAKDKLEALHHLSQELQIPMSAICYVGDSDRDAPALSAVGLGIAPANATDRAKGAARIVLKSAGGEGAVEEALSYVLSKAALPVTSD